jgi:hypothetical protein
VIFRGGGRRLYLPRHYFPIWHAVKDDLVLGLHDTPTSFDAGAEIGSLISLWRPEQPHHATAAETLHIHDTPAELCAVTVDGFLCAANFSPDEQTVPVSIDLAAGSALPLGWGVTGITPAAMQIQPRLAAWEPAMIPLAERG